MSSHDPTRHNAREEIPTSKTPTQQSDATTEPSSSAASEMWAEGRSGRVSSAPQSEGDTSATEPPRSLTSLPLSGELLRKGLHLLALVIPLGMYVLGRPAALVVLVPLTMVAAVADVIRSRSERFSALVDVIFGRMMRPEELRPTNGLPIINGATWVLVSATLLTIAFPVHLAAPAFAAFMVADAAAAIVGIRFGRHRWKNTRRTVEGSAAFGVVVLLGLLPYAHISFPAALTAALTGAAMEVPDWPVNDNVRVPLVIAAVLLVFSL
ncbi:MAG: phosphatidate cytidylyltransferase [Rhodothermales bacterium]